MRRAFVLCVVAILGVGVLGSAKTLDVVATTTLVGDIVAAIAGDEVELLVLLSPNTDPHAFHPTPQDVVTMSRADVLFLSGAGLEKGFEQLLESVGGRIVDLSHRLALRETSDASDVDDDAHEHGAYDPHVWFDPTNVMVWTSAIEETLIQLDPDGEAGFRERAADYRQALSLLDLWIWEQVAGIPSERRLLISDHETFAYFAARYGFRLAGSIHAGTSTLSEPSARELSGLVEIMRQLDVPAVFVGSTADPSLAGVIARESGAEVVPLYTGSLSHETGPAASYLLFMRYNVEAIVEALAP